MFSFARLSVASEYTRQIDLAAGYVRSLARMHAHSLVRQGRTRTTALTSEIVDFCGCSTLLLFLRYLRFYRSHHSSRLAGLNSRENFIASARDSTFSGRYSRRCRRSSSPPNRSLDRFHERMKRSLPPSSHLFLLGRSFFRSARRSRDEDKNPIGAASAAILIHINVGLAAVEERCHAPSKPLRHAAADGNKNRCRVLRSDTKVAPPPPLDAHR